MGMDFKHTPIHYIHEQLAASQQGALGGWKPSHTERTLTMVGVEDGVSPSASHHVLKKNLWSRCLQMYSTKCPNGKIFISLLLLSLPLLAISGKRKINLFYQERQKLGKTKADLVQFGFSLPVINISQKTPRGIENFFILLSYIKNNLTLGEELLFH